MEICHVCKIIKDSKTFNIFLFFFFSKANIADYTDSSWITSFQDSSELMLGISADDLGQLKNTVKKFIL